MRKAWKKWLWMSGLLCTVPIFMMAQSRSKPNIVFILADDLGSHELGSDGNRFNETPNLDQLATQGKKFTQAYAAAPVCSPTRVSIMTGQYPARVRITDFLGGSPDRYLDPAKYTTINKVLSEAGYHTGIIGKWHLDTDYKTPKASPRHHGFDEVIGSETKYIADGDYFFPYDKIDTYTDAPQDEYLTDRQNQDACDFIQRNKDKPFFLYLSYYSVHTKLGAPKQTVEKYKNKFDEKYGRGSADRIFEQTPRHETGHADNPYLAAMLEHIDNGVGMIMQTLKEQGLEENTIVIFLSDNGGAPNVANNGHLRAYKSWLYEGGIRIPLIIRWPGVVQPDEVHEPVSTLDFYPTFVAVAGGDVKKYPTDGVNLLPLLTNGRGLNRREMYWHYPAETGKWTEKMSTAMRQDNYKLIQFYIDNRYELYDLEKDPSERNDLAPVSTQKVKELSVLMEQWKSKVDAEQPDEKILEKARKYVQVSTDERVGVLAEELGLTNAQRKETKAVMHTFFEKQEQIRRKPERLPQIRKDIAAERERGLKEILTPQQWEQLKLLRKKESQTK